MRNGILGCTYTLSTSFAILIAVSAAMGLVDLLFSFMLCVLVECSRGASRDVFLAMLLGVCFAMRGAGRHRTPYADDVARMFRTRLVAVFIDASLVR